MEDFKKKVEKRALISTILCSSSLAVYFALRFLTKNASDFGQGLAMGVWIGMEFVAVVNTVRLFATLKSEKALKALYIKENDERNKAIERETSQKSMLSSSVGIAAGAVVSGFYDVKICAALCGALTFMALVTLCMRAYYNKTM